MKKVLHNYLNVDSYKNRIISRIPKRKRKELNIALVFLSVLTITLNIISWFYFESLAYFTFIPTLISYYLLFRFQKSTLVLQGIFCRVNQTQDFNEWRRTKTLKAISLSDARSSKNAKCLTKEIRKKIRRNSVFRFDNISNKTNLFIQAFFCAASPVFVRYDSLQNTIFNLGVFLLIFVIALIIYNLAKIAFTFIATFDRKYYQKQDLENLKSYLIKINTKQIQPE